MPFKKIHQIGLSLANNRLLFLYKKIKSLLPFQKSTLPYLKIVSLLVALIVSAIILYQSLFYRWFGYETVPSPTITDEYNYVWQGLSLRSTGLPIGWVTFRHIYDKPQYQSKGANLIGFKLVSEGKIITLEEFHKNKNPFIAIEQINYNKGLEHMFFVAPFFDHPPLGGLIYSLGEGSNIKEFNQVKPAEFRKPTLVLAVITAILLFLFTYLITQNPWIASLSLIIYSTVPTYLLATRTAFLENAVPPFILLHLIILFGAIQAYKKDLSSKITFIALTLSGFIGGLGLLVKEPTLGFLVGSTILLFINKIPKRYLITFFLAMLIPIVSYFLWGFWLQMDLFLDILRANTERSYFGALKLVSMLEALKFKDFPTDGWWVWGLLSFLIVSLKKQENLQFLTIPLLFHFLLVLFLGSPNYPWYFISMIPFFACCSAIVIWQIYKDPNIATALAFFFIPFSSSYYWGRVALNLQPSITHYRYSFLIFCTLLILRLVFHKHYLTKIIWLAFWIIIIQKIITFNHLFIPYLVSHWGNLPIPSLPNF